MLSSGSANPRLRSARRSRSLRRNSSFLGTIRSFVAKPLTWFAGAENAALAEQQNSERRNDEFVDDFENDKDFASKRRRNNAAPPEPTDDDDPRATRTKRIRMHSPVSDGTENRTAAFAPVVCAPSLAPPIAVNTVHHDSPVSLFESPPSSAVSASTLHSATFRAASQPRMLTDPPYRAPSVTRMSVDVPYRSLTRDASMVYTPPPTIFERETRSIDMDRPVVRSGSIRAISRAATVRDLSVRPTTHAPFRMRTSMTPQPERHNVVRDASEPPTLDSLRSNPVFVRGPSMPRDSSSTTTLGSLVDAQRLHSPSCQTHGVRSLFDTQPATQAPSTAAVPVDEKAPVSLENSVNKVLRELDVYRTPLIPTRLREDASSSDLAVSAAASSLPDMFKNKRKSRLILLQDEQRIDLLAQNARVTKQTKQRRKQKKQNAGKPYAGEGGMRRLLARRHSELNLPDSAQKESIATAVADQSTVRPLYKDDSVQVEPVTEASKTAQGNARVPPSDFFTLTSDDHFTPLPANMPREGSSLRVGRAKAFRIHYSRPGGAKFSAAYDDDTAEGDSVAEGVHKPPVVPTPAGFSFASEKQSFLPPAASEPKDGPITSLPFLLSAPATIAASSEPPAVKPAARPPVSASSFSTPSAEKAAQSTFGERTIPLTSTQLKTTETPPKVPNFFASSPAFSNPPTPKRPPMPLFSAEKEDLPVPTLAGSGLTPSFGVVTEETPAVCEIVRDETSAPNAVSTSAMGVAKPVLDAGPAIPFGSSDAVPVADTVPKPAVLNKAYAPASSAFLPSKAPQAKESAPSSATTLPSNLTDNSTSNGDKPVEPTKSWTLGLPEPATATSVEASKSFASPTSSTQTIEVPVPASSFEKSTAETTAADVPKPFFSFGASSVDNKSEQAKALKFSESSIASTKPMTQTKSSPNLLFGVPESKTEKPKGLTASTSFTSGTSPRSTPTTMNGLLSSDQSKTTSNVFIFGKSAEASKPASPPAFMFPRSTTTSSADSMQSSASPFIFGVSTTASSDPAKKPFSFVASSNSQSTFGAPATSLSAMPSTPSFSYGAGSRGSDMSKAISFGGSTPRPTTPPKVDEFRMEESPTREMKPENKPTLGITTSGAGFPFASNSGVTSSGPFGSSASTPTFGGGLSATSSSSPFPFAPSKPEEPKPAFGGFGQTPDAFVQRFGSPSTSFKNSQDTGAASNAFGSSQTGSIPGSPSGFNSSTLAFGAPSGPSGLSFGSQPSSPSIGSTALPLAPGSAGGLSNGSSSSGLFSNANNNVGASVSGGGMFTMGSTVSSPTTGPGGRVMKGLPRRRGVKR